MAQPPAAAVPLADQAARLPEEPGVYLFKNGSGHVLYVGKARDLRARVRQYIQGHDQRPMVPQLVAAAASVDVVPVHSEREALLLEGTLIRQYRPRFNSQFKDDGGFLYIRLDTAEAWPRLTIARRPARTTDKQSENIKKKVLWFGPFASSWNAGRTLDLIQRHFPLRTCTDTVLRSRKRPCLLHQMHRCAAPCTQVCTPEEYDGLIQGARLFLEGRRAELLERTRERMMALAEAERFEEAAGLRDLIAGLEAERARQSVVGTEFEGDAWAIHREGTAGVAACLPVREGAVREPRLLPFTGEVGETGELLSSLINAFYGEDSGDIPPALLLPALPDDAEALALILSERRSEKTGAKSKIQFLTPQRGEKRAVLEIAEKAAAAAWLRRSSEQERREQALSSLVSLLGLPTFPRRIECFDNSNLQGEQPVASMVVFIDGKPARAEYRRYHVKTVVGADDFATMREILMRRLSRGLDENNLPDLLVVDGGKGQVHAAQSVLEDLQLTALPMIGLSKPRTERRRGDWEATDRIVLPDQPEPIFLRPDHPGLRLLQHLRDQAHETAIEFHRKQRSKQTIRSALDDIPGVGPARRKALLTHFGSIKGVREATVEELEKVVGKVGRKIAEGLKINNQPDPDAPAPSPHRATVPR